MTFAKSAGHFWNCCNLFTPEGSGTDFSHCCVFSLLLCEHQRENSPSSSSGSIFGERATSDASMRCQLARTFIPLRKNRRSHRESAFNLRNPGLLHLGKSSIEIMSRHDAPSYGVYILDLEEWRQVSEHWRLPYAVERARETHELLGIRVRIRSREGIVMMELQERSPSPRDNRNALRICPSVSAIAGPEIPATAADIAEKEPSGRDRIAAPVPTG